MEKEKVAIIIVNWNGKKFLKNCLNSVFNQTYNNFEVYFIDNCSVDRSSYYVRRYFPKVNIIQLDKNYGFAKGNNEGIKEAFKDKEVEYIVCLNNDTIVDKNWLKELIKTAEKDEKIGSVGSKIISFYEKNKINSLGIIPSQNGNALNYGKNESVKKYNNEELIFGPCAGSALYKRRVLEKVGLFDENYFCYLEDVDLAYRINLAGYYSQLNPNSRLYHIHSGTASKISSFKSYLIVRNSMYNTIKYLKISIFLLYPFITFKIYQKVKKSSNIFEEVKKFSKLLFLKNVFKAYFFILFKLYYLLKERVRIKYKLQTISNKQKRILLQKFMLK